MARCRIELLSNDYIAGVAALSPYATVRKKAGVSPISYILASLMGTAIDDEERIRKEGFLAQGEHELDVQWTADAAESEVRHQEKR